MIDLNVWLEEVYRTSPFWRGRLDEAGIVPSQIHGIDDLRALPVLRKDQLPGLQKEDYPFAGMTTVPAYRMARIFMSPGPIYDPQGSDHDFWRFGDALRAAGFAQGDIVQNTFSYHFSPAGFMFDGALRSLGIAVIPAGTGNTELQVQALKDCKVTGYVGTPSFLVSLLEKVKEKGWSVKQDLSLRKAFFTAERLLPEWRESFMQQGISVFDGYGTADAGCIAYQTEDGPGLKVTESLFVELCDPATGEQISGEEIGEIVVTLPDGHYPLIRFGTGDLSRWVAGYEGERVVGVVGRVGDGVKVRGMFVHLQQLVGVMERFPQISWFQALVTREGNRDLLTIYVEPTGGTTDDNLTDALIFRLKDMIRVTPEIKWVERGSLDRKQPRLVDQREW